MKEANEEKEIMLHNTLVVQLLFTMFFINLETNSSKANPESLSYTFIFNVYPEIQVKLQLLLPGASGMDLPVIKADPCSHLISSLQASFHLY